MTGPKPLSNDPNSDPTVVDAAPDPQVEKINRLHAEANADAEFAEAEAAFAREERERATRLHEEGRDDEADTTQLDAARHMQHALRVMHESNQEETEAGELEDERKRNLALVLRKMPEQSLETLRDAVTQVRTLVEELSPADKLAVCLAARMDQVHLEQLSAQVVSTGLALEQTLASAQRVKADPIRVIEDLVGFLAAAMTIADHFEPLMRLVQHFGQLLLQFRI